MELTAVVGKTSSSEQILGHQLTFLRLSSNIAGAFEDVSVCTLLFGERERKLDYVNSPVFNKLYIESSCGGNLGLLDFLTDIQSSLHMIFESHFFANKIHLSYYQFIRTRERYY